MKRNGATILMECLLEQQVDTVFGYPGGAVLNIYDALYAYRDRIRHVMTAHEQGAAHAADGYARATGRVGVCIATSGPGATNLVTGIATAYMDSVPMVAITGNVAVPLQPVVDIFQADQIQRDSNDGSDPEYQKDQPRVDAEHQDQENQRDYKNTEKTPPYARFVFRFKAIGALFEFFSEILLIGKDFYNGGQADIGTSDAAAFFADHQIRCRQLFVEHQIEV